MGVRVRLRVKLGDRAVELVALVNSGAESPIPLLVLTEEIGRELGIYPPRNADTYEAKHASRNYTSAVFVCRDLAEIELVNGEEVLTRVRAYVGVDPTLDESIVTDALIDELGIVVIKYRDGLWRHSRDPSNKVRTSAAVRTQY